MTDNEIIKALECCADEMGCTKGCPCFNPNAKGSSCTISKKLELEKLTIDLVNRQKAEIDRLETENKLLIENAVSNKYPNCVSVEKGRIYTRTLADYDELICDISAEAIKEFAEELKDYGRSTLLTNRIIDGFLQAYLKEKVGDNE